MSKQYVHFSELPVTTIFAQHGNTWKKVSSKTARIVTPVEYSRRWFYFGQDELCIVNRHTRVGV